MDARIKEINLKAIYEYMGKSHMYAEIEFVNEVEVIQNLALMRLLAPLATKNFSKKLPLRRWQSILPMKSKN